MRKLRWLDIETTGLNPDKDAILEIVVGEADFLDPFNVKIIHRSVMWCHPEITGDFDPYVVAMHTKNGLFKECGNDEKALDLFEAEAQLLELIPQATEKEDLDLLAGSSIHFDHEFIKVHMPKLNKRFSHRHYDVSAIKLFCESRGMTPLQKAEAHRAEDDILESIAHAKACEEWLRTSLK